MADRPATYDEIISAVAKAQGIAPELALAVARRESSMNPSAVGDGGKAIGMFQVHPGAAQDTGTADRSDPLQNITGGVTYLKQLNDHYKGDVTKVLQAYNGGMGNVDAGTVSPEAQAYATSVISELARKGAQKTAPTQTQTPAASTVQPEQKSFGRMMLESVDPRLKEGRQNIAGMTGALVGGVATRSMTGVRGGFKLGAAAAAGAGLGGALEEFGEQLAHYEPTIKPYDIAVAGGKQAAYEAGGQALMWPLTRFGRSLAATRVGRYASQRLTEGVEAAKTGARGLMRNTQEWMRAGVETARDTAREALENTREAGRVFIEGARTKGQSAVSAAAKQAEDTLATVRKASAERLAQAELDAADIVARAEQEYRGAVSRPPSRQALTESTRAVVSGLPGLHGQPAGPAKKALDIAGRHVDEVAAEGPMLKTSELQAELRAMAKEAEPASFFPPVSQEKNIGFLFSGSKPGTSAAAASLKPSAAEQASFLKAVAAKLGVTEQHPLPGILGKMFNAPEEITFADMHQFKRLLDEGVRWDQTAKKHIEAITKGLRVKVRQAMNVFEPYNEATAAYMDLVPYYRKGAGKQLIAAAAERPDRLATLLKASNPDDAAAIHKLLVEQSAAGGDAAAGQRAWDAVRATYTYDNLLSGGVKNLENRIDTLVTQHPEFAQVVYGDPIAQRILQNYKRIGAAFRQAVEQGEQGVAAAKTAGATAVEQAQAAGRSSVQTAQEAARTTLQAARQTTADSLRARRVAGRQDVQAAQDVGRKGVEAARETASGMVKGAQDEFTKFKRSSMGRYANRPLESEFADVLRAFGLGPKTIWGAVSLVRLLQSPRAADLIEAAAHSDRLTQGVVRVLTGSETGTAAGAAMRELVAVASAEPTPAKAATAK